MTTQKSASSVNTGKNINMSQKILLILFGSAAGFFLSPLIIQADTQCHLISKSDNFMPIPVSKNRLVKVLNVDTKNGITIAYVNQKGENIPIDLGFHKPKVLKDINDAVLKVKTSCTDKLTARSKILMTTSNVFGKFWFVPNVICTAVNDQCS